MAGMPDIVGEDGGTETGRQGDPTVLRVAALGRGAALAMDDAGGFSPQAVAIDSMAPATASLAAAVRYRVSMMWFLAARV